MGVFIVIWTITAISVIIAMYYQNSILVKPNKNVLIGVTIPFLQLNNNEVIRVLEDYKKWNKRLMFYSLIGFIPSYFSKYISLQITYLFIWIAVIFYFSNKMYRKYNKKLMELKRKNHWMLPSKRLITIDTELTRLKDKMPVSFLWFIPSILLSLIPIVITYLNRERVGVALIITSFTVLIGTIIFMILYKIYAMKKSEVVSEDSKINITCNRIYIRLWTSGTVVAAFIHSISMIFIFMVLNNILSSELILIIVIAFTMIVLLVGIFYINERIRKEQNELLRKTESIILSDNDEYWSTGFYINPNDRAVMVPDRAGYGMTFNIGNKKGKRIFFGMLFFSLIVIMSTSYSTFRLDFGKVTMDITKETITINAPQYGTSFDTNQIVEVSMVNKIPKGIRTNGAGSATYNIGSFNIEGYGKCKEYVYFQNPNYICIKLKDESYIFINSKSLEETNEYFEKLKLVNN